MFEEKNLVISGKINVFLSVKFLNLSVLLFLVPELKIITETCPYVPKSKSRVRDDPSYRMISTPKFSIPTDDSSNYASGYDPRNKTSLTSSRRIGSETMERNQSLKRQKSITLSEKELKQTVKPSVFRIVQKTVKTKIMKTLRGIHEFLVSKKDATFHSLYQITIILMKPIHV